jgi:hypothetical protein
LARLGERLFDPAGLLDFLRYSRNMSDMLPFDPQEFALTLRIDNRLAAVRVARGEAIELYEVVELMSASRCLYNLATLVARELETAKGCLALWSSMRDQFSGMCQVWEGVPPNEELTACHRAQLTRLKELCEDQLGLYRISSRERLRYAKNREDAVQTFNQRSGIEPGDGYRDQSTPQHIYTVASGH